MSFDISIAESIQSQTAKLVELVSDETSQTAYEVESQLWQSLLVMGQHLMQLFFDKQEEVAERHKSYEVDGVTYGYRGQRKRQYVSLFGEVSVGRAYYWNKGEGGQLPLDEALSLPERSFSELVQERVGEMTVMMTYEEATACCFRSGLDATCTSVQPNKSTRIMPRRCQPITKPARFQKRLAKIPSWWCQPMARASP